MHRPGSLYTHQLSAIESELASTSAKGGEQLQALHAQAAMLRVQLAQEAETNRKLLSAQSAQQARATRIQRSVAMKMGNLHGTRALQVVFVAWRDHLLREKALGAKRAEAVDRWKRREVRH